MFSNRTLYTHTGRKVRFYDDLVKGRIVTVNLAYTRCTGSCPSGFRALAEPLLQLGERAKARRAAAGAARVGEVHGDDPPLHEIVVEAHLAAGVRVQRPVREHGRPPRSSRTGPSSPGPR